MFLVSEYGALIMRNRQRDLKIRPARRRGFLRVGLKRESAKMLKRMDLSTLNRYYLNGRQPPQKKITLDIDVFKSVRMFKHMRKSLEDDNLLLLKCIRDLQRAADLMQQNDIREALIIIRGVADSVSNAATLHKIIAHEKLLHAISKLEKAKSSASKFDYYSKLNPAISIVLASIRRFTARQEMFSGKIRYALEREMHARYLRDEYIYLSIVRLYRAFESRSRYAVLNAYLADCSDIMGIKKLVRMYSDNDSRFLAELCSLGRKIKRRKNKRYIVNLLRNTYKNAVESRRAEVLQNLNAVVQYMQVNKPFYFADQLIRTKDEYAFEVQSDLLLMHNCIYNRQFKQLLGISDNILSFYKPLMQHVHARNQ